MVLNDLQNPPKRIISPTCLYKKIVYYYIYPSRSYICQSQSTFETSIEKEAEPSARASTGPDSNQ